MLQEHAWEKEDDRALITNEDDLDWSSMRDGWACWATSTIRKKWRLLKSTVKGEDYSHREVVALLVAGLALGELPLPQPGFPLVAGQPTPVLMPRTVLRPPYRVIIDSSPIFALKPSLYSAMQTMDVDQDVDMSSPISSLSSSPVSSLPSSSVSSSSSLESDSSLSGELSTADPPELKPPPLPRHEPPTKELAITHAMAGIRAILTIVINKLSTEAQPESKVLTPEAFYTHFFQAELAIAVEKQNGSQGPEAQFSSTQLHDYEESNRERNKNKVKGWDLTTLQKLHGGDHVRSYNI
ncbi:hypothetical protein BC834DRAFT_975129 [Gloeopeniophorella convolvens]|nr:hypothetical protein BC834DRAFT_975129 [Gloeopeniophorella convolvens]